MPQLTPLQQQFYYLIVREKQLTPAEAASRLGISEAALRQELATLRHLELLRGAKTSDGVVIILFQQTSTLFAAEVGPTQLPDVDGAVRRAAVSPGTEGF